MYPRLNPRAFRSTELAREFARRGHDVTLYGETGEYDYTEFTKNTGVKVRQIKRRFTTLDIEKEWGNFSFVKRMSWIALGYFFEFPEVGLVKRVYNILKHENDVDLLVTVAHPHPIHWGAALRKKIEPQLFPKTWISDCGDPFMLNPFYKKRWYFKYIEEFWGRMTDFITIPIENAKSGYYPSVQSKLRIIPQGFDYQNTKLDSYAPHKVPHFAYAGAIYPGMRDPTTFLQYLVSQNYDFCFTIYTKIPEFFDTFKKELGDKLQIRPFIPREQLIFELSSQDFLINFENPNAMQAPSKLVDYALTKRPIIKISTPFNEEAKMQNIFAKGKVNNDYADIDISAYDIRNVADAFLALTDRK